MSSISVNTPSLAIPAFGHGNIKAWCLTGNFIFPDIAAQSQSAQQIAFDGINFVDGHNLYLDETTQISSSDTIYEGALKFSFVTPLETDTYKVFVKAYGLVSANPKYPQFAHVVNSARYPKTKESFWIRMGFLANPTGQTDPVGGRSGNQVMNVSLWSAGAQSSLGLVVF